MSLSDPRLRRAALLISGAAVVHELRYALAPVDGGAGPGHAYLHAALPAITVLFALAAAGFVARLLAPRQERGARRALVADWLGCTLVLFSAFVLQVGAESLLSAHVPIFAAGGWLAAPLAVAVGLAAALLARGARAAAEAGVRAVGAPRALLLMPAAMIFEPLAMQRRASAPLRHLAARPPPGSPALQHR